MERRKIKEEILLSDDARWMKKRLILMAKKLKSRPTWWRAAGQRGSGSRGEREG